VGRSVVPEGRHSVCLAACPSARSGLAWPRLFPHRDSQMTIFWILLGMRAVVGLLGFLFEKFASLVRQRD
jgi:hypothetical protein